MTSIRGRVTSLGEPVIPIILYLGGKPVYKKAVIDTGFNGSLSLPAKLAQKGNWHFFGVEEYELATGDIVQQKIFIGQMRLDKNPFSVYAVTSHSEDILIGTHLLRHRELIIQFKKRKVFLR